MAARMLAQAVGSRATAWASQVDSVSKNLQLLWEDQLEPSPRACADHCRLSLGRLISDRGFRETRFVARPRMRHGLLQLIGRRRNQSSGKNKHLEYSQREPQVQCLSWRCPGDNRDAESMSAPGGEAPGHAPPCSNCTNPERQRPSCGPEFGVPQSPSDGRSSAEHLDRR